MAERRIEGNFSQGWGFALFICLLTAGCFAGAFAIHKKTFYDPTDVTAPSASTAAAATAPSAH